MSRLKGWVAAGQLLLQTKPATLARYGRVCSLLLVGPLVLFATLASMAGPMGSSIPVPPRKPDQAGFARASNQMVSAAYHPSTRSLQEKSYRSPFSGPQMDLYRDIFRHQAAGSLDEADALIAKLKDKSLMGHVLAQRYLQTSYKVKFSELKDWMANYADHPQAGRIAKLANARRPSGEKAAVTKVSYQAPAIEELVEHGMAAKAYKPKVERSSDQNNEAKGLINAIRTSIQKYEPSAALNLLNESKASNYLDNVEKDRVRAMTAAGYLYAGKTDEALKLSAAALKRSKDGAPMAGWINGLAHWRLGQYKQSIHAFETAAESPYATGWMVSAASYWAARGHEKAGHKRRMNHWLEKSAEYPKTFYGLLANAALGRETYMNWDAPSLSGGDERDILDAPAGMRAEKLLAAGEVTLAEAEIRALYVTGDDDRKQALMAYAYDRGLPSLTMKLAHAVSTHEDSHDAALYPAMPWTPNKGFRIDRALIHAIARQESRFNAAAENKGSGATGLMQIMPRTAMHVSGEDIFLERDGKVLLKHPEVSLDLGQKYVEELLNSSLIGQDLLSLAIAYNAGPGRLAKWKSERADITDPLLFVETIPYAETRTYAVRVLANYWIYRMKFDQPNDSLIALADGKWARYAAHDKGAVKFADAR